MIEAKEFIEAAREFGFSRYTGVPCSFLTPFINYVINDDTLEYVSSANEGDALATAAGAAIGGQRSVVMMQNSGLGNAISPLTSLSYVFRIPNLLISTHRGQPGIKDEPQHELMGQITKDLFDTMCVPWEVFLNNVEDIGPALERADYYMKKEQRPYAFIMEKGTVAPQALYKNPVKDISSRKTLVHSSYNPDASTLNRNKVLQRIIERTPKANTVLIATTGFTGRELFAIDDRSNHFYMVGSMGCASSLGLGVALARSDLKVVIIDGDGAGLMRMGNFATIGSYAGHNLIHILLNNEVHDSTGGQATVGGNVDFLKVAEASGYSVCLSSNEIDIIDKLFNIGPQDGPVFAHLRIASGTIGDLPRPDITPNKVLNRLMKHINSSF